MKRFTIFAAVAALVLGACAKTETFITPNEADAVSFGAYSGRNITKAGPTDDMNLKSLATHGFGVFATYSQTNAFSEANDNFMYNQQVTSGDEGATWTYQPVKYWPNPTNGQSADDQKVSFFAYAPYCKPGASETKGITGFEIGSIDPADPTAKHNIVKYTFSPTEANVDLMWGYRTRTGMGTATDPYVFTVNKDLTRQATKIPFIFRHLLAKLGGSYEGPTPTPDPYNDPTYKANGLTIVANPTLDPTKDFGSIVSGDFGGATGTKITVKSILVKSAPETEGTPAVAVTDIDGDPIQYATGAQTGKLDLYTGKFKLDATATAIQFEQNLTNDAAAVAADATNSLSELADFLKEPTTPPTDITGFGSLPLGVTKKEVNVYKDEANPIILVPGTKPVVDVTITYVVRTYDSNIPGKGFSEVPQTVFGRVKFPEIEENKKYNLRIILGLNDVKFEASVQEWATDGDVWNDANGNGAVDPGEITPGSAATEINLPANL